VSEGHHSQGVPVTESHSEHSAGRWAIKRNPRRIKGAGQEESPSGRHGRGPARRNDPEVIHLGGEAAAIRGPAQRPVILHDTAGQAEPPRLGQRGITVDHEDLPGTGADCGDPHRTRRSSLIQDHPPVSPSPTSWAVHLDAVFVPTDSVRRAAAAVADREGLDPDWLNDAVKGFLPGPDPNAVRYFEAPGLLVDVASAEYLLAMKLFSSRVEADAEDIALLYREVGYHTVEEGLALVERSYPGRPIAAKVQFCLRDRPITRYRVIGGSAVGEARHLQSWRSAGKPSGRRARSGHGVLGSAEIALRSRP
jgi:hypothetical protein